MAHSTAKLRVVETLAVASAGARPIDPERTLRRLFKREAKLRASLREIERSILVERNLLAKKHNLLMLPSVEALRRTLGQ